MISMLCVTFLAYKNKLDYDSVGPLLTLGLVEIISEVAIIDTLLDKLV